MQSLSQVFYTDAPTILFLTRMLKYIVGRYRQGRRFQEKQDKYQNQQFAENIFASTVSIEKFEYQLKELLKSVQQFNNLSHFRRHIYSHYNLSRQRSSPSLSFRLQILSCLGTVNVLSTVSHIDDSIRILANSVQAYTSTYINYRRYTVFCFYLCQ